MSQQELHQRQELPLVGESEQVLLQLAFQQQEQQVLELRVLQERAHLHL
jgi:hypothetical protein